MRDSSLTNSGIFRLYWVIFVLELVIYYMDLYQQKINLCVVFLDLKIKI